MPNNTNKILDRAGLTAEFLLQKEFENRQYANPAYSMRAFAKHLGMSAASVSNIFRGKQDLSFKSAQKICSKIFKDPKDQKIFLELANKYYPSAIQHLDEFEIISDWYNNSILESLTIPKYSNTKSLGLLAQHLGIDSSLVEESVKKLEKIGYISTENGKIKINNFESRTANDISNLSIKMYHKQMLERSKQAVDDPVEKREFQSMTFALPSKDFPKFKNKIRNFISELARNLSETEDSDQVYSLNIGMFEMLERKEKIN